MAEFASLIAASFAFVPIFYGSLLVAECALGWFED